MTKLYSDTAVHVRLPDWTLDGLAGAASCRNCTVSQLVRESLEKDYPKPWDWDERRRYDAIMQAFESGADEEYLPHLVCPRCKTPGLQVVRKDDALYLNCPRCGSRLLPPSDEDYAQTTAVRLRTDGLTTTEEEGHD